MILDTEAAIPYCNWSIKMDKIIWFGSTSMNIGPAHGNNWHRLSLFLGLCNNRKFPKTKKKTYFFIRQDIKKASFFGHCPKVALTPPLILDIVR